MSDLGSLYFSLGMDDAAFNEAIEKAKEKISSLDEKVTISVSVNTEQVQNELSKLSVKDITPKIDSKTIEAQIAKLESNLNNLQSEIDKATSRSTPNVKLISEKIDLRTSIENEIEELKKKLADVPKEVEAKIPSVKIKLDLPKSEVTRIKGEVKQSLANSGMDISINPKISKTKAKTAVKAALENLEQTINVKPVIPKKNLKKIELEANQTILRKSVTDALKNHRFSAKLDLIVDKANVQDVIKQAFAQAGMQWNTTPSDVRTARVKEIDTRTESKRLLDQEKLIQLQKKGLESSKNSAKGLSNALHTSSDWASQLANQFNNLISIYAIERFIRNLYTIGGEFQKQQIALQNMIGDVDKGNAIFERMKGLSVKSPYTFSELASYTKQMAAYGIEYNELYDTTKRLADISAGVGVDMGRLILAYGQVRSAEVLRGQELRQFTEAGIPLVAELAKRLEEVRGKSVAVGEVFDAISKREISFGMVKDVLFDMTDPGGRFFKTQEKLAESLAGQWSNLKDAWEIMIADIANQGNTGLSVFVKLLTEATRSWREWAPVIMTVVGALGTYTAAIKAATMVTNMFAVASGVKGWQVLLSAIGGAASLALTLGVASKDTRASIEDMNSELEASLQTDKDKELSAMRYLDILSQSTDKEDEKLLLQKKQQAALDELTRMYEPLFKNMSIESMTLDVIARKRKEINEETKKGAVQSYANNKVQLKVLKLNLERELANMEKTNESNKNPIVDSPFFKTLGGKFNEWFGTSDDDIKNKKLEILEVTQALEELDKAAEEAAANQSFEDLKKTLTLDSSEKEFVSVFGEIGKAVRVLRKGGITEQNLVDPKLGTGVIEFYDEINEALKKQRGIMDNFSPNSDTYKSASDLVSIYEKAIKAIDGIPYQKDQAGNKAAEEAAERNAKVYYDTLKAELAKISSQWDLYKEIFNATGNRTLSMNLAFDGEIPGFANYIEHLKGEMSKEIKKNNLGISVDELLRIGNEGVVSKVNDKTATAWTENVGKNLNLLIDKYNEANNKLRKESIDNFLEIINASKDFAQQISDIERKLEKDLSDLRSNAKGMPESELKRRENELIKKAEEDKNSVRFEQFKESSDWVKVFDDLDRVSNATLDSMIKNVEELARRTNLSVKETKELVEALGKLRDESIERNPLKGFNDAWNRRRNLKQALRNGEIRNGMYYVADSQGWHTPKTKEQIENELSEANEDLKDSSLAVADKFQAVANAADLLSGLFENLGIDLGGISDLFGGMAGGAQAGAGIASAFGLAGPWGAIAGAAVGMLSSVFAMHDKALQKEIEASEARTELVENISKNLEETLERNLGGIYTTGIDKATRENLKSYIKDYELWKNVPNPFNKGVTSKESYDKAYEALNQDSYYDAQLASLMLERDELKHRKELEADKKKADKAKLADYEQELVELESSIKNFALDMANTLYGIDFKDWAGQLAESLVSAWASGEDAVEAYKDTVNNILRDLGVSVISQKIIEPLLQSTMDDFLAQFEKDNGKLTESSMSILAGMANGAEEAAKVTEAYFEGLKKLGIDLSESSDEAKDSLSKGVQGVTEDTANLLGSYLNSIRQSVHVKQQLLEKLVSDDIPQMSYIAQAQLQELNQIAANTKRNADAADKIYDLVNRVVDKGSNKIKV